MRHGSGLEDEKCDTLMPCIEYQKRALFTSFCFVEGLLFRSAYKVFESICLFLSTSIFFQKKINKFLVAHAEEQARKFIRMCDTVVQALHSEARISCQKSGRLICAAAQLEE